MGEFEGGPLVCFYLQGAQASIPALVTVLCCTTAYILLPPIRRYTLNVHGKMLKKDSKKELKKKLKIELKKQSAFVSYLCGLCSCIGALVRFVCFFPMCLWFVCCYIYIYFCRLFCCFSIFTTPTPSSMPVFPTLFPTSKQNNKSIGNNDNNGNDDNDDVEINSTRNNANSINDNNDSKNTYGSNEPSYSPLIPTNTDTTTATSTANNTIANTAANTAANTTVIAADSDRMEGYDDMDVYITGGFYIYVHFYIHFYSFYFQLIMMLFFSLNILIFKSICN